MSWEYKTTIIKTAGGILRQIKPEADLDEACNAAGREGWELVTSVALSESHGRTGNICLFFKRPR